jgi:hypothetical protein
MEEDESCFGGVAANVGLEGGSSKGGALVDRGGRRKLAASS